MGWTSFDVVNKLRHRLTRRLGIKKLKIGHAGTLDPLATGLLLVCVGQYTKRIDELQGLVKEYTGVVTFGATTPSFDLEKAIDQTYPTAHLTTALLEDARRHLTGPIQQVPPMFSAVKIDGKRLYKHARTGQVQALEPRSVEVLEFELSPLRAVPAQPDRPIIVSERGALIYRHPDYAQGLQVDFRVVCTKGTYIRSIAHDIGAALQTGSYLSQLRRTAIGPYRVEDAWVLEALINECDNVIM